MNKIYRLPASFVHDRLDRDMDCGTVTFRGRTAIVECDAATLRDIREDAEYQGWHTDNSPIVRSARRAFAALEADEED